MTKAEMLDVIYVLGFRSYYTEHDSYRDILEELRFVMKEARRTSVKNDTRDLFRRD